MITPQTVLITGATSGFGEAAARGFAACGCNLILTGRRQDRLDSLKKELSQQVEVLTIAQDISDLEAVRHDIESLPEAFRAIDVLVNNAGAALGTEPAHKARLAEWQQMVDVNIKGLLAITHAVLPGMAKRKKGHIINIGSIAGTYPYPGGNAYCGTKAFVNQFSLALRADLNSQDVRVTSLEPGAAETEFSKVRFRGDDKAASQVYNGYKPLSAEDVADIIVWVATRPAHVNINRLEVMATAQAFSPFAFAKKED